MSRFERIVIASSAPALGQPRWMKDTPLSCLLPRAKSMSYQHFLFKSEATRRSRGS
jgi:hypothetical protein